MKNVTAVTRYHVPLRPTCIALGIALLWVGLGIPTPHLPPSLSNLFASSQRMEDYVQNLAEQGAPAYDVPWRSALGMEFLKATWTD